MKVNTLFGAGALLGVAMTATPMKAEKVYTVQELYEECKSENVFCAGFVEGVMGVMGMVGGLAANAKTAEDRQLMLGMAVCTHGHTTLGDAVQAFENWVPKHPKHGSDDGLLGVMMAIQETWPCK
jgi:hypothetical protein